MRWGEGAAKHHRVCLCHLQWCLDTQLSNPALKFESLVALEGSLYAYGMNAKELSQGKSGIPPVILTAQADDKGSFLPWEVMKFGERTSRISGPVMLTWLSPTSLTHLCFSTSAATELGAHAWSTCEPAAAAGLATHPVAGLVWGGE